jgi:hypothetical protein
LARSSRWLSAQSDGTDADPRTEERWLLSAGSLAAVKLTEFWHRMREQFGEVYAESVAKDQVLGALGGRTVNQALADGEDAKIVWRAVVATFDVPERLR